MKAPDACTWTTPRPIGALSRACIAVFLVAAVAWAPGRAEAQMDYVFGACSRVVIEGCEGCDKDGVLVGGGFTLTPSSVDAQETESSVYEVRNLLLSAERFDLAGFGVLLVDGKRASLLGVLGVDGRDVFFSAGGTVTGRFPFALRIDHLVVDSLRFDLYGAPAIYPDDDGDAVVDADDHCPATPCGAVADDQGCALEQRCPCEGQADGAAWGSHRDYVRCVIGASRDLLTEGRIDPRRRSTLVKEAADSACGRSVLASLFSTAGR